MPLLVLLNPSSEPSEEGAGPLDGLQYFGAYYFSPYYFGNAFEDVPDLPPQLSIRIPSRGILADVIVASPIGVNEAPVARRYGTQTQQTTWVRHVDFWFDAYTVNSRRPPIADQYVFAGKEPPTEVGITGTPVEVVPLV